MSLPDDAVPIHNEGFLRFVEVMGDDHAVVRAARVSYGDESKGDEADCRLVNDMIEHEHGTPFESIIFIQYCFSAIRKCTLITRF